MSFPVHTEKLNLVTAFAAEENDEKNYEASLLRERKHEYTASIPSQFFKIGSWQSHRYELTALMNLAIPTLAIQLGSVLPGFLIASYIGRSFEVEYLDGFTLASLTVNLFVLSLLQGLYSASDTLSPQAYGAGNMSEVGYLAIRGFAASMLIVLPIALLLIFYMKNILVYVGEDVESVTHAWRWYQIDAIAIPFYSLYQVTMKFLSAQNQMTPLVVCSILSTCIVLPISLWFFGGVFGFLGTAIAMVIYQVFQSISLLVYLWWFSPHDPETWPGFRQGWTHAIQWKPFIYYMVQSRPMFSSIILCIYASIVLRS
jgi:multidrug resistance protein, MATE family